jgi:hypothetical protein
VKSGEGERSFVYFQQSNQELQAARTMKYYEFVKVLLSIKALAMN